VTRVMLLADRAEGAMASIFRQVMMARFEVRAYAARGEGKALTRDRLAETWMEENERYYADSLDLPDGYRLGWSYVPHFIHVRFYTYAYAFAHLVAFSLAARYREDPERFTPASSPAAPRARRRTCSRRSASTCAILRRGRTPSPSSTAASPRQRSASASSRARRRRTPRGEAARAPARHCRLPRRGSRARRRSPARRAGARNPRG
jgi:oligoendopeptidase F